MPTPRHGSSSIISLAQRASSRRVFFDASGALSKRSMMRGSMAASPMKPTAAIGRIRMKTRRFGTSSPAKNMSAKVTANDGGIIASAPREYVLTMQADAAMNAKVFSNGPRQPRARKQAKKRLAKRCIPIARPFWCGKTPCGW